MTGFKFPLLICLLIFHATNKTAANIDKDIVDELKQSVQPEHARDYQYKDHKRVVTDMGTTDIVWEECIGQGDFGRV